MKLVIGLGNPGDRYKDTRHNIGFMVIDEFLKSYKVKTKYSAKFNVEISEIKVNKETVLFVKPSTYMNLSGTATLKMVNYYKIELKDILVIVDDINLPLGKLRIRELGGHGGHNGLRNIIDNLKTEDFKRVRIGIDFRNNMELNNYVLGRFTSDELITLAKPINDTCEVIKLFIEDVPFKDIMTKYNTQTL